MELTQYRADPRSYASDPEGSAAALDAMQYMIPGWGDGKSAVDVYHDLQSGDMDAAKLDAALFGLGLIPVVGDVGSGLLKGMAKGGKMIAPTAKAATASTRATHAAIQEAYDTLTRNWKQLMSRGNQIADTMNPYTKNWNPALAKGGAEAEEAKRYISALSSPYPGDRAVGGRRLAINDAFPNDTSRQMAETINIPEYWPPENPSRWGSTTGQQFYRTPEMIAEAGENALPAFHGRPSTAEHSASTGWYDPSELGVVVSQLPSSLSRQFDAFLKGR